LPTQRQVCLARVEWHRSSRKCWRRCWRRRRRRSGTYIPCGRRCGRSAAGRYWVGGVSRGSVAAGAAGGAGGGTGCSGGRSRRGAPHVMDVTSHERPRELTSVEQLAGSCDWTRYTLSPKQFTTYSCPVSMRRQTVVMSGGGINQRRYRGRSVVH
jgi:hypothetical protein